MALVLEKHPTIPYTYPDNQIAFDPQPTKGKAFSYFTSKDIAEHSTPDNIWLSWLGNVYDLTPLIQKHSAENPLLVPLLKCAGQDISHWFDSKTGEIKSHVSALTEVMSPYTPSGLFIDIPPCHPRSDFNMQQLDQPWYRDPKYFIGKLTVKSRKIRLMNTLCRDEMVMVVCSEESMNAIQERYLKFNGHAKGYMWKRLGALLDMTATLEGNGIMDEEVLFDRLGMDSDEFIPTIHLFFSDDLTIA